MKAKKENGSGLDYFLLAMIAFGGLGLEVLLSYVVEPLIYGTALKNWTTLQYIIHWTVTCILWGCTGFYVVRTSRVEYKFNVFDITARINVLRWLLVVAVFILCIGMSWYRWGGSKVFIELQHNGWLKFVFQYIYYFFEAVLLMLILVFGQKAFDVWLHKYNIPFGGIVLAFTSGFAHVFTKGLEAGIYASALCVVYGGVYVLLGKELKKSFPVILLLFLL